MVTNATPEMLPKMKALWNDIFGDSLEYITCFFENNLQGETEFANQFVYLLEGQPVSMLTVLEGKLCGKETQKKFWYIYAVLTDKKHRKKGYAAQVLRHVLALAEEQNITVGLVPASDALYLYYEKLGFRTFFYRGIEKKFLEGNVKQFSSQMVLEEATVSQYKRLRDAACIGKYFVMWDEKAVKYALQENEHLGGKAYVWKGTPYFLLVCPVEEELVVRETNLPVTVLQDICNQLGTMFHCKTVTVSMLPFGANDRKAVRHGMIYNSDIEDSMGYLGLALD